MALLAGGENVAAPSSIAGAPSTRNNCWRAKPEVILMAGYESVSSGRHAGGQNVSTETVRQRLHGFAARPGWSELPAVKQGASMPSTTALPAASWMPP